jgi:glycosyltransferase involved in cell wall biosynthesis
VKVAYLLAAWGATGGSLVLYKFMDYLVEHGYQVFAITPSESIEWQPNSTIRAIESGTHLSTRARLVKSVRRMLQPMPRAFRAATTLARSPIGRRLVRSPGAGSSPLRGLADLTEGLVKHWRPADVTISTFSLTSYANQLLSDRTRPLYHMQHFEELFFTDALSRRLARLTYFLPFELLANSSWLRERVREATGQRAELLLPGIDLQLFRPEPRDQLKYSDPKRFRVVSYYSELEWKGWADALRAMEIVFGQLGEDRVEWLVFGGQPTGRVHLPISFVGRQYGESLASLYSSGHVAFSSSWYESFPLPPLEAMACGTAVVTTSLGTEDYARDGDTAVVVPPRDPRALGDSICRLLEQPQQAARLAEAGHETASSFSWSAAGSRLEAILGKSGTDLAALPASIGW